MTAVPDRDVRPAATYVQRLADGRLSYQICLDCQQPVFYPRVCCPRCGGVGLQWRDSAGIGIIYSVSVIPKRESPDNVICLVDLREGFRMMSVVVGDGAANAKIGDSVSATFDVVDEQARVVFTLGAADD